MLHTQTGSCQLASANEWIVHSLWSLCHWQFWAWLSHFGSRWILGNDPQFALLLVHTRWTLQSRSHLNLTWKSKRRWNLFLRYSSEDCKAWLPEKRLVALRPFGYWWSQGTLKNLWLNCKWGRDQELRDKASLKSKWLSRLDLTSKVSWNCILMMLRQVLPVWFWSGPFWIVYSMLCSKQMILRFNDYVTRKFEGSYLYIWVIISTHSKNWIEVWIRKKTCFSIAVWYHGVALTFSNWSVNHKKQNYKMKKK